MSQMKQARKFLTLILMGVFLVSCASQDERPTGTPQSPGVTNAEVTDTTRVDSAAAVASDNQGLVTATKAVDSENGKPLYTLDWKINENEVVAYKTAMNPVDGAEPSISFNIDRLFAEHDITDEVRQQLAGIRLPEAFSMISVLERNSRDNISVKMIVLEVSLQENASDDGIGAVFDQLMSAMEGTVQIRGELTPDGAISSFYLEQEQRNLLAMLFELPTDPVYVGDSWEIDVNCIAMGNGFIAANAERVNRVEFAEVRENADGELLAVLDYFIAEAVDGHFQIPFSDEAIPTTMTCTFLGQGLFLIEEGRWEQFTAEFALKATGLMNTDAVQHFALTPLEDVPQEFIDLE
jgi:hypothetical protein